MHTEVQILLICTLIYIYIYTVYVYIHIHEWIHTHMYTYICNACVDRCGQVGGSQPPWSGKIQLVSPTEACNRPAEKLWQFGHLFYVLKKHILRGSKQILHDQFPQQNDFSTFLSRVSMIFPCALTQETIIFFFYLFFFDQRFDLSFHHLRTCGGHSSTPRRRRPRQLLQQPHQPHQPRQLPRRPQLPHWQKLCRGLKGQRLSWPGWGWRRILGLSC